MHMIHQRSINCTWYAPRWLSVDSSPQLGFDLLCVKERRILLPRVCLYFTSSLGVPEVAGCFEERSLPMSCLGKGKSTAARKVLNLCHSAGLELHADWRRSVRSVCTDLGAESKIADSPMIIPGRWEDLTSLLEQHRAADSSSGLAGIHHVFLIPNAIYMIGQLHSIWNAAEEAITRLPVRASIESKLTTLASFSNDRGLVDRFIKMCMPRAGLVARRVMRGRVKSHISWRWGTLESALLQLLPRWAVLRRHWRLASMTRGGDANIKDALITKVDELVSGTGEHDLFRSMSLLLLAVLQACRLLGRLSSPFVASGVERILYQIHDIPQTTCYTTTTYFTTHTHTHNEINTINSTRLSLPRGVAHGRHRPARGEEAPVPGGDRSATMPLARMSWRGDADQPAARHDRADPRGVFG